MLIYQSEKLNVHFFNDSVFFLGTWQIFFFYSILFYFTSKTLNTKIQNSLISFLLLESRVSFHDIFQMFVNETIQSWQVIFIVNYCGIWIFVCGKVNKILSFLFSKLNTWSLQMSFHLFNFDVTFSFWIKQSKGGQDGFWFIRLKFLLFQNSEHIRFELGILNRLIGLIFFNLH